jgi:hypothetical protein
MSKEKVTYLHEYTNMDAPADRVLESAVGKLKKVIVIGETEDGEKWFATSTGDGKWYSWILQMALHKFYSGDHGWKED